MIVENEVATVEAGAILALTCAQTITDGRGGTRTHNREFSRRLLFPIELTRPN